MANQPGKEEEEEGGLRDCAFANVRLPISIQGTMGTEGNSKFEKDQEEEEEEEERPITFPPSALPALVNAMQALFLDEFHTFIAVYAYKGKLWTRLSGQVYLDLKTDWEWCGGVLKEVCARVRRGELGRYAEGEECGDDEMGRKAEEEEEEKGGTQQRVAEAEDWDRVEDVRTALEGVHTTTNTTTIQIGEEGK